MYITTVIKIDNADCYNFRNHFYNFSERTTPERCMKHRQVLNRFIFYERKKFLLINLAENL